MSGKRKTSGLVYGFGVNDVDTPVTKSTLVDGKSRRIWVCPHYDKWSGMLHRCYVKVKPSYERVFVCEDWRYFSSFKKWSEEQSIFDKSLCLDKDILGGCMYSPEYCRYVPMSINNLIVLKNGNTHLLGVTICRNKFKSNISINGKNKNSPRYDNEFEAHRWWQIQKIQHMKEKLSEYKSGNFYISEIFNSIHTRIANIETDVLLERPTYNLKGIL